MSNMDCDEQLLEAAKSKDVKKIKQLLSSGANPNIRDDNNNSALHFLLTHGNTNVDDKELLEAAVALIGSGAILDWPNEDDNPPLTFAVITNRYAVVKMLLETGACVDLPKDKRVGNVKPRMARLLSEWGATFHLKVQPNIFQLSRIFGTYDGGALRMEEINPYVRSNHNANIRIKQGGTTTMSAFHYATRNHYHVAMRTLVFLGANPNTRDDTGRCPLEHLLDHWNDTTFDILVMAGANLNVRVCGTGKTLLFFAVKKDSPEMIEFLVDSGASINIKDEKGVTPYGYSLMLRKYKALKKLLELGADTSDFQSHVVRAAKFGDTQLLEVLASVAGNVNGNDNIGRTPLHIAVLKQSVKAVEILINGGADINSQNKRGRTPLQDAHATRNPSIINLLKEASVIEIENEPTQTPHKYRRTT